MNQDIWMYYTDRKSIKTLFECKFIEYDLTIYKILSFFCLTTNKMLILSV